MTNIGSDSEGAMQEANVSSGRNINQTMDNHGNHELDTQSLLGSDQVGEDISQGMNSPPLATGLRPDHLISTDRGLINTDVQFSHRDYLFKDSQSNNTFVPLSPETQEFSLPFHRSDRDLNLPNNSIERNYSGARPRFSTKEDSSNFSDRSIERVEKRCNELANSLANLRTDISASIDSSNKSTKEMHNTMHTMISTMTALIEVIERQQNKETLDKTATVKQTEESLIENTQKNRSADTQSMAHSATDLKDRFIVDPYIQYNETPNDRTTLYAPPPMYETPQTMSKHMYPIKSEASPNNRGIISHSDQVSGMERQFTPTNQRSSGNRHDNLISGKSIKSKRHSDRRHRRNSRFPESSESEDSRSSVVLDSSHSGVNRRSRPGYHVRLPPFTAQEEWKVYYNRFKAVAKLEGWSDHEKLRELLPRLQGKAGEFVHDQLRSDVRNDFGTVVKELKHIFHKVETARTYGAKFSRRNQISGESVENFAAELKRLYDKGYPNRDRETRREDLLRRFLDGIIDDNARFQLELNKEPFDIDEAVFKVITCQETRKRTPL